VKGRRKYSVQNTLRPRSITKSRNSKIHYCVGFEAWRRDRNPMGIRHSVAGFYGASQRQIPKANTLHRHSCNTLQSNTVFCLLEYNSMHSVESQPTFRSNTSPPSSRSMDKPKQNLLAILYMLVSSLAYSPLLNMEATCYSETSVDFQRTTWRYIQPLWEAQIITIKFYFMGTLYYATSTDGLPVILSKIFRAFPQFLQENSGRGPPLGHDGFLPNSLQFIIHPTS
jgi:hypothetical protein